MHALCYGNEREERSVHGYRDGLIKGTKTVMTRVELGGTLFLVAAIGVLLTSREKGDESSQATRAPTCHLRPTPAHGEQISLFSRAGGRGILRDSPVGGSRKVPLGGPGLRRGSHHPEPPVSPPRTDGLRNRLGVGDRRRAGA
jgi:hypothetical protein